MVACSCLPTIVNSPDSLQNRHQSSMDSLLFPFISFFL